MRKSFIFSIGILAILACPPEAETTPKLCYARCFVRFHGNSYANQYTTTCGKEVNLYCTTVNANPTCEINRSTEIKPFTDCCKNKAKGVQYYLSKGC